jgi:hypothetical protein
MVSTGMIPPREKTTVTVLALTCDEAGQPGGHADQHTHRRRGPSYQVTVHDGAQHNNADNENVPVDSGHRDLIDPCIGDAAAVNDIALSIPEHNSAGNGVVQTIRTICNKTKIPSLTPVAAKKKKRSQSVGENGHTHLLSKD